MSLVYRVLGVGAALTLLAGCGGGGNHAAALPPSGASAQSKARVPATFKVIIPPKSTSTTGATRTPKFISPSTQSIAIAVNGDPAVAQNITTGGANCNTPTVISPTTCTVTFNAPVGNDAFVITTYDQPNSGPPPFAGNILSQASFSQNIVAGQANVVNVSLGGFPVSLTVSPLPDSPYLIGSTTSGFTSYFTEAHHVAVLSYDADNNPIVGTGVPSLSVVGTAGLTVTAPSAGASQNVFTVQNAAFNTSESLTVTATPATGSGPGANVLTQVVPVNTKHIVVSIVSRGTTTGTLNVYNDDTSAPVRTLALDDNPTGFFTDNQGDAVIPMQCSTVEVFTGAATTPTYTLTLNVTNPRSGCSDHESNIYIANGGNTVLEFPNGGANTNTTAYTATLSAPQGCVIDVDDSLWVLNNDATLSHFPAGSNTNDQHFALSGGVTTGQAFSLGIDRAGDLFVGYGTGTHAAVQVYPKGSQTAAFEVATLSNDDPSGNAVDIGGSLWVGNFTAGSVERFGAPITAASVGNAVTYSGTGTQIKLDVTPKALPTTP
jgi:hypothetical protein